MKNYENALAIVAGRKLGIQEPIDDRIVWGDVSELNSAITAGRIASWYFGMIIYVGSTNQFYVWCDSTTATNNTNVDDTAGFLASGYTYPATPGLYTAIYAGKTFNFYPLKVPTHNHDSSYYTQAQITSFLAGKANTSHTHTESQITNLDKYTKAEVNALLATKAALSHQHAISDIDTLQTVLNDKANTSDLDFLNAASTTLLFDSLGSGRTYYDPTAYSGAAAFTLDTTNAVAGAKAYVFSNRASSPSISGTSCVIALTQGIYNSNNNNIIQLTYIGLISGTHYFIREYISATQAISVSDIFLNYTSATGALETRKTPVGLISGSGSASWDLIEGFNAHLTLSQNIALSIGIDIQAGDRGTLVLIQDAIGSRTVTVSGPTVNERHFSPGGTGGTSLQLDLSTAPTYIDVAEFYFDGANFYWKTTKNYS